MEQQITNSIQINAPANAIWDAITHDNVLTEDLTQVSDWHRGSANDYYLKVNHSRLRIWKGNVTEAIEPYYLEQKVFSNLWNIADVPENYLTTQYIVCPVNDESAVLTIIQKDFNYTNHGEERYLSARNWWKFMMPKIKNIAEKESTEIVKAAR